MCTIRRTYYSYYCYYCILRADNSVMLCDILINIIITILSTIIPSLIFYTTITNFDFKTATCDFNTRIYIRRILNYDEYFPNFKRSDLRRGGVEESGRYWKYTVSKTFYLETCTFWAQCDVSVIMFRGYNAEWFSPLTLPSLSTK